MSGVMTGAIVSLRRSWPLALLLLACLSLPGVASAYVYYPNGPYIGRAHNDGTGLEPEFIEDESFNCGIAVDSGHIYWGALGKGIGRANLDGSGVEEEFIPLSPTAQPCGVAVDAAHVYWTDRGGKVGVADLNGANAEPDLITGLGEACGIAAEGGHAYFGRHGSGNEFSVLSFDLPYAGLSPFAAASGDCGVALDSGFVYWANGGPASTLGSSVQFASRAGGPPVTLVETAGGSAKPWSVAVHGEYAYWSGYNGPIGRVLKDGSAPPEPNFLPLGAFVETVGIAVDDLPAPAPPPGGGGAVVPPAMKPTLRLGKPKVNRKTGTARLDATVSGAGVVKLAGKGLKAVKKRARAAGKLKLTLRAKGAARDALGAKGKVKVAFKVTFTASAGGTVTKKGHATLRLNG